MLSNISKKFQEHPNEVNESYGAHFVNALYFAGCLFFASVACLLHAVLPFLCKTTGSSEVKRLYSKMVVNRNSPNANNQSSNNNKGFNSTGNANSLRTEIDS
tara:strand:- start:264 stop:569 length:306 start_codon:yes stop_codon:yes gene_type:complete